MERMMDDDSNWTFYWPETVEEAQEFIDFYRDLESGK
jgi:hypothetical protein